MTELVPLSALSGAELRAFPLAYQAYGRLSRDRSNVILVCHALTGDQFVAETHPITGKPGWAMRADVSMHSTHCFGALNSVDDCAAA